MQFLYLLRAFYFIFLNVVKNSKWLNYSKQIKAKTNLKQKQYFQFSKKLSDVEKISESTLKKFSVSLGIQDHLKNKILEVVQFVFLHRKSYILRGNFLLWIDFTLSIWIYVLFEVLFSKLYYSSLCNKYWKFLEICSFIVN